MQVQWDHFIGGLFRASTGGQHLDECDPRTGKASFKIARGNAADVDAATDAARQALAAWRASKPLDRGRILTDIGRRIREQIDALAAIEQIETGKPFYQARFDIEIAAQYFEFYGGLAPGLEGETINIGPSKHCYTLREPFGVIGAILPWNAPANQLARAVAPALACGNTVVAKPSEFTSVSSLRLAEIATAAGLPPGCLNVVTGTGLEVGAVIVEHPVVAKIVFTGSLRAGREIGIKAAGRVIPVTLELGGKSPNIVFADAHLQAAAAGVTRGFTVNAGQACIAGTRVLVEQTVAARFEEMLVQETRKLKVGESEDSQIGPIITGPQFEKIKSMLEVARQEGASTLTGGQAQAREGYFIEPTILSSVSSDFQVVREEVFGPVCTVQTFETEAQAIEMANATDYGLAAGLWTQSLGRAHRVAAQLQAGQVYVNEYPSGGVETPFGGYKQSGIGREKGREALHHYSQIKTVIITLT